MEQSIVDGEWSTYQHHRFGPGSTKEWVYLDVVNPGLRWCIRVKGWEDKPPLFPHTNTWRAAYGLMRKLLGKSGR
jgi:hypothetical protein